MKDIIKKIFFGGIKSSLQNATFISNINKCALHGIFCLLNLLWHTYLYEICLHICVCMCVCISAQMYIRNGNKPVCGLKIVLMITGNCDIYGFNLSS